LFFKVLLMQTNQPQEDLVQIRHMMERSSKFISLSGWSGVAAGLAALGGAWWAAQELKNAANHLHYGSIQFLGLKFWALDFRLITVALVTFLVALSSALFFSFLNAKKRNLKMWDRAARRLLWNACMPMAVGGVFCYHLIRLGDYGMIAPACLLFYGLALVNASKFTLGEVRYMGYGIIVLGLINCWFLGKGLLFWTLGFGLLHIVYGCWMWYKHERNN
jgi:hypothetical protein